MNYFLLTLLFLLSTLIAVYIKLFTREKIGFFIDLYCMVIWGFVAIENFIEKQYSLFVCCSFVSILSIYSAIRFELRKKNNNIKNKPLHHDRNFTHRNFN